MQSHKPRILFLCTGNSCRSQMAEGWARHLLADNIEPYSAGIESHGLNPLAVLAMAELGIDISEHQSKTLNDLATVQFDHVITVCAHADEHCPTLPGTTAVTHVGFDDPPKLARDADTQEDALVHYRRVRDEIGEFIRNLPSLISIP